MFWSLGYDKQKPYTQIRIRNMLVEKLVQWVLIYIQRGLVDIWKKNVLEDLETRKLEFLSVGD